ncbi:MAG: YceH family protein, partial [Nocardioidaceae bacterium]
MEPDAVEIRVLGCLIEKQRTTPDAYPLSLNALRLACNQSTNRDPVVDYDDTTVRAALERLGRRRWTRLASWAGSRAMKYRHLFDEALGLSDAELALLCVLMLRGPQTSGELKARSERIRPFSSTTEVEEVLARLVDRGLAARLPRRPGQREERFEQRLGGDRETADGEPGGVRAPAEPSGVRAPAEPSGVR